jgi:hypothetical protein
MIVFVEQMLGQNLSKFWVNLACIATVIRIPISVWLTKICLNIYGNFGANYSEQREGPDRLGRRGSGWPRESPVLNLRLSYVA